MASHVGTSAALLSGGLVCLMACRQLLGIETRTEGAPPLVLGEACGACVDSICSDAERTCAADPACAKAAACMAEAGLDNPNGRAVCREQHAKAAATSAFAAVDACMRADCQTDCYGTTGFFGAYSPACQLCTEQSCGDAPSRCVADADCERLAVEAFRYGPVEHEPAALTRLLFAAFDTGEQEREIGYCPISTECDIACGFDGANLDCVSDYSWPISLPATATLEAQAGLFDFNASVPFAGAVIDVCRPSGETCSPSETKVADADGFASFVLKLDVAAGFRGFARVRAGEVDGKETWPSHVFAYPMTRDVRGLAPAFRDETVSAVAAAIPGGLRPDRAQVVVQYVDCSTRRASDITLSVLPASTLEGATTVYRGFGDKTNSEGLAAVFNAKPGCLDIGGHNAAAGETHRTRIMATPGVITWVYVYPLSAAPIEGYACTPAPE